LLVLNQTCKHESGSARLLVRAIWNTMNDI